MQRHFPDNWLGKRSKVHGLYLTIFITSVLSGLGFGLVIFLNFFCGSPKPQEYVSQYLELILKISKELTPPPPILKLTSAHTVE